MVRTPAASPSKFAAMSRIEAWSRNTESFIGADELAERVAGGRRLRVKLGVDPTRPDLTFGHLVVFNKLRQFQEEGHEAVLIIGDYTAMIGDPSGRSSTRPVLTPEEVAHNADTYLDQAFRILHREQTEVRYNSEWFSKMSFGDCLELSRKMTVARMLERDDFAQRTRDQSSISIVEFLYPLIQGYDSVVLQSDLEIGGSDQLFNMLVGRTLQRDAGQPGQAVLTMPLLVGLDGQRKMSKSYDNYIAFTDSATDMFGKVMSIGDEVMWNYYRLLLDTDGEEIESLRKGHPMEAKKTLGERLVTRFFSAEAAREARAAFEQVFSRGENPDEMPIISLSGLALEQPTLLQLLGASSAFGSRKEIQRLIEQGGVKINGKTCTDRHQVVTASGEETIIQAGKRKFFKVVP